MSFYIADILLAGYDEEVLHAIKIIDKWKSVPDVFICIAGVWKQVSEIYVKENNQWRINI